MLERYVRLLPALKVLVTDIKNGTTKDIPDLMDTLLSKDDRKKIQQALPVLDLLRKFILIVEKYSFNIGELPHLVYRLRIDLRGLGSNEDFTYRVRITALGLVNEYFLGQYLMVLHFHSVQLYFTLAMQHYLGYKLTVDEVWKAVATDGLALYTSSHSHENDEDVIDIETLANHLRNLRKSLEKTMTTMWRRTSLQHCWWKDLPPTSQHAFLAPLARMYLAIPATSASAEPAFSSAGFLLDGRERLTTEHLEMQLIIRDKLIEWKELPLAALAAELEKLWK